MNWTAQGARPADIGLWSPAGSLRFVINALRSTTAVEAKAAFCAFVSIAAIGLLLSSEFLVQAQAQGMLPSALATMIVNPAGVASFGLLCWVVADRMPDEAASRQNRLVVGLLACALLHALITPTVANYVLGIADPCQYLEECRKHGLSQASRYLRSLASAGNVLVFGGLAVTLIELRRRQRLAFDELLAEQQQRTRLTRETIESRLAAMQAQVEPQFLFDGLVDIQALYERDARSGDAALDRLIAYLRTALPRLRESGSTLGAEAELVDAYLEVVKARHDGRPLTRIDIAPDAAGARFYPMLLLPLVQRAVHGQAGALPREIVLSARRSDDSVEVTLHIDGGGSCADDSALTNLRERLTGLFGGQASLECTEHSGGTIFTLRFADGQPDRDRRRG